MTNDKESKSDSIRAVGGEVPTSMFSKGPGGKEKDYAEVPPQLMKTPDIEKKGETPVIIPIKPPQQPNNPNNAGNTDSDGSNSSSDPGNES